MKRINLETKTGKIFAALQKGEKLTASDAAKRFGVKNLSAEASRIRQAGYAVYANTRKAGNGVTVTLTAADESTQPLPLLTTTLYSPVVLAV